MKRIFLLFLILLAGCIIQEPDKNVPNTGDEGIKARFTEGNQEVYEDSSLEIVTEFRNNGRYDQPFGKVVLYGYDSSIIRFENQKEGYAKQKLPELNAKTSYTPKGGYNTLSFRAGEENIKVRNGEVYETELVLAACYHYKTSLTEEVCIAQANNREGTCRPKPLSLGGQGAPVAVTKIEQEMVSNKLEVVATIENVGDGKVIAPDKASYDACPFSLQEENENRVSVEMKVNGLTREKCSDSGLVSLAGGEGKVHCTFSTQEGDPGDYSTQLNVKVDYNYLYTDKKELSVLSTP